MKTIRPGLFALSLALFIIPSAHGRYPYNYEIQAMEADEVSPVDQYYLDEIRHKSAAPIRTEKTRNEMKDNPRNAAFAASFGSVTSHTPPP